MTQNRSLETDLFTVSQARKFAGSLVYALCDVKGEAFYVGQTKKPSVRFYMHSRSLSARAMRKYNSLGANVRVSILAWEPEDLDAAERAEILKRPWCLNVVVPGHWRWGQIAGGGRKRTPWLVDGKCPSAYAIKKIAKKEDVEDLEAAVASVPKEARLLYEMDVYTDLPAFWRIQLEPWIGEAVVRFDELYDVTAEQRRMVQRHYEASRASAREEAARACA